MPTDLMRSERGLSGPAQLASQLVGLWNRQSRTRRALVFTGLVALTVAIGWVAVAPRAPSWQVVVTAHRDEEAHECVAVLQRKGIAVRANGRDVEVAPRELARALAALEAAGLPDAGRGLGEFADDGLLNTNFAEQVSYKRGLQDELARSIKGLAPIDGARVHLALGHRSLFKDREQPPSASVALRLRPGQPLSAAQVRGIQQLVVGSVEGLRLEEVAVIDHLGNLLEGERGSAGGSQAEIERVVSGKVRELLERVVGEGNVEVVASADVDLRKVEERSQVYERERAAVTAETRTLDRGAGPVGAGGAGPVGASGAGPVGGGAGGEELAVESKTYAPSHVTTATQYPGARLRRLHLAVVVDYHRNGDGALVPPSELELAQWTALARSAAGLDESRGDHLELQAMPFAVVPARAPAPPPVAIADHRPLLILGVAAAALIVFAVAAQLRARRRYARRLEQAEARAAVLTGEAAASERRAAEAVMAARAAAQEAMLRGPAGERAAEAVRSDVVAAALVLAAWLAEEPGPGAADGAANGAARGEGALS